MVHGIRFSSLSVFRTNYNVPGAFFPHLNFPFDFCLFLFHFILSVFSVATAYHATVNECTQSGVVEHRLHIKWIQFHFIFSICFICPRDKYWRYFYRHCVLCMGEGSICLHHCKRLLHRNFHWDDTDVAPFNA